MWRSGSPGRRSPANPGRPNGAQVGPLSLEEGADGVYALIDPTPGPRTADNRALNANFGFVVTDDGMLDRKIVAEWLVG